MGGPFPAGWRPLRRRPKGPDSVPAAQMIELAPSAALEAQSARDIRKRCAALEVWSAFPGAPGSSRILTNPNGVVVRSDQAKGEHRVRASLFTRS